MSAAEPDHPFRDYSAPRADNSALMDPPPAELPHRLRENRERMEHWRWEVMGVSIREVRQRGREDLLKAALQYTRAYRDVALAGIGALDPTGPLVMAGHQPELFHPGVWFKNFVLSRAASDSGGAAVNLVVDNDLCGPPSVSAPTLQNGRLTRVAVPYDGPTSQSVPLEQRWIADRALFDSFDARLADAVRGIVADPLVVPLWRHARRAADRCENIGCSLAQARHALEGELGLRTLELPISVVCRSWSFSAFVLALVQDLPQLRGAYNECLFEYRAAHNIRSSAHPVPALGQSEDWYEVPLWIYGDDDAQRRPAWARRSGNALELSDRVKRTIRVDAARPEDQIDQLQEMLGPSFKLRPRALVTTMFARLVLSDLFLHGIGGAKYDQLGDMIIRRMLGIEPPTYGVLSATLLLPGAPERSAADTERAVVRAIRDLDFTPERFADQAPISAELLRRKRQLLAEIPARGAKAAWHREITEVNRQMRAALGDLAADLEQRLAEAKERSREDRLWQSREHPFPVYPLDRIHSTFKRLLGPPTP